MLSAEEVAELRAIGDNTGSMVLKGAAPDFEGEPLADRWPITADLPSWPAAGASRPPVT